MNYLLDTNAVSRLLKRDRKVWRRLSYHSAEDIGISAIAMSELWAGALELPSADALTRALSMIKLEIIGFDAADARQAGEVRAYLAKTGQPIDPLDTLIAGQAVARGLTLVTHNTGEFVRVPGLRLEDWEA